MKYFKKNKMGRICSKNADEQRGQKALMARKGGDLEIDGRSRWCRTGK